MKLLNQTDWRTDQIRPILQRIAAKAISSIEVTLTYGRQKGVSGTEKTQWRAVRQGRYGAVHYIELRLPRTKLMAPDLAYVFSALLLESYTAISGAATEARRALWWSQFSWAIPMIIEKKAPASPNGLTQKKIDRVWRALKAAERKRKLYTTITAKWKKKIQTLEKKLPKGEKDGGQERPEETARLAV